MNRMRSIAVMLCLGGGVAACASLGMAKFQEPDVKLQGV